MDMKYTEHDFEGSVPEPASPFFRQRRRRCRNAAPTALLIAVLSICGMGLALHRYYSGKVFFGAEDANSNAVEAEGNILGSGFGQVGQMPPRVRAPSGTLSGKIMNGRVTGVGNRIAPIAPVINSVRKPEIQPNVWKRCGKYLNEPNPLLLSFDVYFRGCFFIPLNFTYNLPKFVPCM